MIEVLAAGPLTTVQDGGRVGWRTLGVPAAGPADWLSHAIANRLVGNPDSAAALECTLAGPRLRFDADTLVAGVGFGAPWTRPVGAGETVAIGRTSGVRGYVAVAGGIDVPPVLGSRGTDTLSGLGPPKLAAGMRLPTGTGTGTGGGTRRDPAGPLPAIGEGALRVVAGPHGDWFRGPLPPGPYTVTPASDRVGVRLDGPPINRVWDRGELPVTGMVAGALQVPPDGQPILLLANHGPTGGYPVIGVVATADLPAAGQARPGQELTFEIVPVGVAREAYRTLRAGLDAVLSPVRPG